MPERTSRARGTGSLRERTDSTGNRSWVGVWRDSTGTQLKRVLGPVRGKGSPVGLSKTEAEQELRKRMSAVRPADARVTTQSMPLTVQAVAGLMGERQRIAGRRPATIRAFDVNVRGDLAHICNHAIREGWLQTNLVAGAVRPRSDDEGGKDLRFLDVESGLVPDTAAISARQG